MGSLFYFSCLLEIIRNLRSALLLLIVYVYFIWCWMFWNGLHILIMMILSWKSHWFYLQKIMFLHVNQSMFTRTKCIFFFKWRLRIKVLECLRNWKAAWRCTKNSRVRKSWSWVLAVWSASYLTSWANVKWEQYFRLWGLSEVMGPQCFISSLAPLSQIFSNASCCCLCCS